MYYDNSANAVIKAFFNETPRKRLSTHDYIICKLQKGIWL